MHEVQASKLFKYRWSSWSIYTVIRSTTFQILVPGLIISDKCVVHVQSRFLLWDSNNMCMLFGLLAVVVFLESRKLDLIRGKIMNVLNAPLYNYVYASCPKLTCTICT